MYRYILRYYIDPGFREIERRDELADFCVSSAIDEVMLFLNPEELFRGWLDDAELEVWLESAEATAAALREKGIAVSVNPWTTLVHLARGRSFGEVGRDFTPMVGETGAVSDITACPLCSKWQDWLCREFARIAGRLEPEAIWIEDDWRLHNHEASMNYGGCFCRLHLEKFARLAGVETVTREEILKNILAPGEPHPWRKLWLRVCRESLLEPARRLRAAVPSAVKLALMSSSPDVHASEGRDWKALQHAFAPSGDFLCRPHLPPYTEGRALQTLPSVTRLTIANYDRPLKIYPELENSPRCGRYSKSAAYSAWEILTSVCYGSSGITINHYDMMGNGIALDPGFGGMLEKIKPRLNLVTALKLDDRDSIGIDVLFKPNFSETVHTGSGRSMTELYGNAAQLGDTLTTLGFSIRFVTAPTAGRLTALCGQTVRALSDDELRMVFSSPCLIDAETAAIMVERSLGGLIGVSSCDWIFQEESGFAYEETSAGRRMCAQRCSTRILRMTPEKTAESVSRIHRFDGSVLAPGMVLYKNRLGGKVAAMAYPVGGAQFFMAYFSVFRQEFMLEVFKRLSPEDVVCALGAPLLAYLVRSGRGWFAGVVNPCLDPAEGVSLLLPSGVVGRVRRAGADGVWHDAAVAIADGRMDFSTVIPPLDGEFIYIAE
ncbi:MAG: hypothetical protein PHI85_01860 [Victivallaceae bacterium]|nr:hypothetical protein [Victivallaceae bacterium]